VTGRVGKQHIIRKEN